MKRTLSFLCALAVSAVAFVVWGAPNYTGPAAIPDAFNNICLGVPSWFPVSTTSNNIVIGGGTTMTNNTNNIYIGNAGISGDFNVVRIGGAQTNVYLSGPLTSAPANTNITTIAQGSTGYTNTLSTDGMAYIYSTNGAISLWAGNAGTNLVEITGIPSTAGVWSFLLLPGWSITSTNLAGKFVQGP